MRKIVPALFLIAACGSGKLYSQVDVGDGKRIYEGMSSDEVTRTLGRPDNVSSGIGRKYSDAFLFQAEQIKSGWIEWAWNKPGKIYVAYLEGGIVQKVGVVTPTSG